MDQLTIVTNARTQLVDITAQVRELVRQRGWAEGALLLWCPHTTGALTVNEAADPDVARDVTATMNTLVPRQGDYHHAEGNSDAHVKTSLFGPALPCIVSGGQLRLGTWQGIYFCEWDGPRTRQVWAQFLPA